MATHGGVLIDAGVLEDGGQKLTKVAEDNFIKRVEELLANGGPPPVMLPCLPTVAPSQRINLQDRAKYPDLYDNVLKNYLEISKTLNVKGQFMLLPAIADPIALGLQLNVKMPTVSSIGDMIALFPQLPALLIKGGMLATDIPKLPTYNIPSAPIPLPTIPKLPPLPNVTPLPNPLEFFKDLWEFLLAPTKLPDIFASLILKLLNPSALIDLLSFNLQPVCKAMKDGGLFGSIPPGATMKAIATRVLMEKTGENLGIAVIGSTIGSDPKGATGLMGKQFGYVPPDTEVTAPKTGKSILYVEGLEKTTPTFRQKLIRMCEKLGVNPDHMVSFMMVETAKTFSPSIRNGTKILPDGRVINPSGKPAVGLIQFTTYTAKTVGTTWDDLVNMTAEEQLDYVQKYYELAAPNTAIFNSVSKLYIAIAYGSALYKSPNAIAFTKQQDPGAFDKNPAWHTPGSDVVYVKNITAPAENVYASAKFKGKRISADDDTIT